MACRQCTYIDDVGYIVRLLNFKYEQAAMKQRVLEFLGGFGWTYAPAQGYLTTLLISKNFNSITNIILGRLLSLLFGIITILVVVYIMDRFLYGQKERNVSYILGIVLISFCWEEIIYSGQAEPYIVATTFSAIILLMVWEDFSVSLGRMFMAIAVLTCAGYFQYQLFIVVAAAFASLFFYHLKEKTLRLRVFAGGVLTLIFSAPLLYMLLATGNMERAVNWNAGPNGEFLFDISGKGSFISYSIKFFVKNSVTILKFYSDADQLPWKFGEIIGAILLFLFVAGICAMYRLNKRVAFFQYFLLIEFIGMVVSGKLTLSPSRHVMFLYPIIVVNICLGAKVLIEEYEKLFVLVGIISISLVVAFTTSIPQEAGNRVRLISENEMMTLIEENNIQYIYVYPRDNEIQLFDIEGYSSDSVGGYSRIIKKNGIAELPKSGDKVLLYSDEQSLSGILNSVQTLSNELELNDMRLEWSRLDGCNIVYRDEQSMDRGIEYSSIFPNTHSKTLCILEF